MPVMQVTCHQTFLCMFTLHFSTALTPAQQKLVIDLRDPPTAEDGDWEMLDDILAGDLALPISHEGGELDALMEFHEHVGKTCLFLFQLKSKVEVSLYICAAEETIDQITTPAAITPRAARISSNHS